MPREWPIFRRLVWSALKPSVSRWFTTKDVVYSDFEFLDHDMPPIFDIDDVNTINTYKECWVVSWLTPILSMDDPKGVVGKILDEGDEGEDRAEETHYRAADIFTNVIDEEYDEDADPN